MGVEEGEEGGEVGGEEDGGQEGGEGGGEEGGEEGGAEGGGEKRVEVEGRLGEDNLDRGKVVVTTLILSPNPVSRSRKQTQQAPCQHHIHPRHKGSRTPRYRDKAHYSTAPHAIGTKPSTLPHPTLSEPTQLCLRS